jgi:hypothetical protein
MLTRRYHYPDAMRASHERQRLFDAPSAARYEKTLTFHMNFKLSA